ncbi:hypothetical protein AMJ44_02460 [candidate division WOR-1 bacterium DG_54_3]|uniref:Uncharacterized protein n=1 Tax=candidate division WOR-1 bacterium DG_54_3 TaxID=1703775 RepID=A0A0S7Y4V4_UNCSA|nr:MAG: hypothetical protein AMJ44_02460 [candidate division WOR-1 bacterium DG_54_3]
MLQEMQGMQGIQGMSSMPALLEYQRSMVLGEAGRQKVKEEFLAIFYKELLKQAFKAPSLGFANEDNSLTGSFGSDLFVERLALELAKSGAFSAENLFPIGSGK